MTSVLFLAMARLCKEINPLFSELVLKTINNKGVFTTIDFLEENPEKLALFTKLPFKDILRLRHIILANFSALSTNGKIAHSEVIANSVVVSTGISSFDKLLGGGFLTGNLYEVYGLSGCCKTQLCLTIAMNISFYLKQNIYYVDAKLDFSSHRIFSMLEERNVKDNDIAETLKRINVVQITNVFELFSFLNTLHESLTQRMLKHTSVRLVIIDSLPAVLFSLLSDGNYGDIALKSQLACKMKRIATECHVAFLLVNLASKNFDETVPDPNLAVSSGTSQMLRPALGKQWMHIPSTRLLLTKVSSQVNVSVVKSTCIRLRSCCILNIKDEGLV